MKLFVLLLLVGCATESLVLKSKDLLPYKESAQLTKLDMGKLKPITISKIVDKRKTNSYGSAYTGVQYQKTPLYMDLSLDKFLKTYLIDAFSIRNLIIENEAEVALEIEVNEMWVEEVIEDFQPEKARCKMNMAFHINLSDKKWSGEYWSEFTSSGDLSDGTERLAPTMASCLNETVEKLVKDPKFLDMIKR